MREPFLGKASGKMAVWLLLALLVADGMALIPGARANIGPFEAVWNDASGWDTGTKISTDSMTDSCLASGPGVQLNATGGFYTASERCPTGAPNVSSDHLLLSLSNASHYPNLTPTVYRDFSELSDPINSNAYVVEVSDAYLPDSKGLWFSTTGGLVVGQGGGTTAHGWADNTVLSSMTVVLRARFNFTTCQSSQCTLLYDQGSGTACTTNNLGYLFSYFSNAVSTTAWTWQWCQNGTPSVGRNVQIANITVNAYHTVVARFNYTTGKIQVNIDGVWTGVTTTMVNPIGPTTTNRILLLMNSGLGLLFNFRGTVYDLQIYGRWLSNAEVAEFSHRGLYATSGFWYSDYIDVTNLQPYYIALGTANTSDYSYISALYIFDSNDTELWHDFDIFYETRNVNITHIVLPTGSEWPEGNQTYYLGIALASPGNETVQLTYAALIFAPFAANPPTLDTNAVIFLFFIFAFFALLLVGYMLDSMIPMMIDGILLFLMSFQVWDYTASIPITLGLVVVGILFMTFPVVQAFGLLKGAKT